MVGRLDGLMRPVSARPEFKAALKQRLYTAQEAPRLREPQFTDERTRTAIWSLAGVLGGLLVLLTGIRAFARISGRAGAKQEDTAKEEPAPAFSPAG